MAFKAPYIGPDELRAKAAAFNEKYNPTEEIPVDIDFIVESDFKIDIVPVPGLQSNYDIDAFISRDRTEIRVDEYVFENRSNRCRFSLAHELAHLILHADLWEDLRFSTIAEWKEVQAESIPEKEYSFIEHHANVFAGLILVPSSALRTEFDKCVTMIREAGLDPSDVASGARESAEKYIAKQFDVSAEVIHRRVDADSLWHSL